MHKCTIFLLKSIFLIYNIYATEHAKSMTQHKLCMFNIYVPHIRLLNLRHIFDSIALFFRMLIQFLI